MAKSIALTWYSADSQSSIPMGTYPAYVDRAIAEAQCTEDMLKHCADESERADYLAGYYTWTEVE